MKAKVIPMNCQDDFIRLSTVNSRNGKR